MKLNKYRSLATRNKLPALLLAAVAIMGFAPSANATHGGGAFPWEDQEGLLDQPLAPYYYLPEHYYTPLPPILGTWQESTDGTVCQRNRTVDGGGCYFNSDPTDPDYDPNGICIYPDHGVADSQVGVYAPGLGCIQWKTTHYVLVSGDGTQTGTLQDN